VLDQFRQRADLGGDHRRTGRKSLDDDAPERLGALGGTDEHGRALHELAHFVGAPRAKPVGSGMLAGQPGEQGACAGYFERRRSREPPVGRQ